MAISEMDNLKAQNTFDLIDASSLEPKTKADLKESVEEAKLNLNGRTLEERCASIARNQFDTTRFLSEIIIQFNKVTKTKNADNAKNITSWKQVLIECKWPCVVLGGIICVCSIFQSQIIGLMKAIIAII